MAAGLGDMARAALGAALALGVPLAAAAQTAELQLRIVDTVRIADKSTGFLEPSGLALAEDGETYWSVSDDTRSLFLLSDSGKVLPKGSLRTGVDGLEGIAADPAGGRLLAVRENSSEVIALDLQTGAVSRHPLGAMAGFAGIADRFGPLRTNDGLEGIAFDSDRNGMLLTKQRDPRLLIRVSGDLSTVLGAVELTADLGYACAGATDAELDVSDILYDSRRKRLWVLSDTGNCVWLADPVSGQVLAQAPIAGPENEAKHLHHPEGLALNSDGTELRIVTDNGNESRMILLTVE